MNSDKTFLFLQGPASFFSRKFASYLEKQGANCLRINFCFSDWVCWLGKPAVNFRKKIEDWPEFLRKFIKDNHVTTILYYADCFPYHRIAREVADDLGIDAIAYENGYLRPNWLTIEKGGMSQFSHFPVNPDEIIQKGSGIPDQENMILPSAKFWVEAVGEVLFHTCNYLYHWTFHNYQADRYYNPFIEYFSQIPRLLKAKKLDAEANQFINTLLNTKADFWLFPLQMQNDYQLRVNSNFKHQSEAIELVIKSFSKFSAVHEKLVIKIHPMDNGIEPWNKIITDLKDKYAVSKRVFFVDGGNLQNFIVNSRGVITINSTVGLHSLQALKPVYVLGCAIYDIKGLASDQSLGEFFQNPVSPDKKLLDAFIKLIAASIQVKGHFFTRKGSDIAIRTMSEKLLMEQINSHGAFVSSPQRNIKKCPMKK